MEKSGPEKGLDRKLNQWEKSGLSAQVGGIGHDAVSIATTRLSKLKAGLDTREEYQEEITYWIDWLFKKYNEKISYESIPVIEEVTYVPIVPKTLTEEQVGEADLEWQKKYDQNSKLQDIKEQL